MTAPKKMLPLPSRTPAYVTREIGAAELCISPNTWDAMVTNRELPPPQQVRGMPRWKWTDVERWLAGERESGQVVDIERVREASRAAERR